MSRRQTLEDRSPPGGLDLTIPQRPYQQWGLMLVALIMAMQSMDFVPDGFVVLSVVACVVLGLTAWLMTRRPRVRIQGLPGLVRIQGHLGEVPIRRRVELAPEGLQLRWKLAESTSDDPRYDLTITDAQGDEHRMLALCCTEADLELLRDRLEALQHVAVERVGAGSEEVPPELRARRQRATER